MENRPAEDRKNLVDARHDHASARDKETDQRNPSGSAVPGAAYAGDSWFGIDRSFAIGISLLISSLIIFCFEIRSISSVNGWWLDELASMWYTEPRLSFRDIFNDRIITDSNAPLYYSILFFVRHIVLDGRSAILILNVGVLIAAITAVVVSSRKFGLIGFSLAAAAALLISGPILRYVVEGRSYLMALMLVYIASWLCWLTVEGSGEGSGRRQNLASFALVGMLAALTHLFAALFCCCLSAGMIVLFFSNRRREILGPALVLGTTSCCFSAVWLIYGVNQAHKIDFIIFSMNSLVSSIFEFKIFAFGPRVMLVAFLLILTASILSRAARYSLILFLCSFILFFVVPIIISFERPIILGRYWLVGAPVIIVFTTFFARSAFLSSGSGGRRHLHLACGFGAVLFLLITDVSGFMQARAFTANKSIWEGAAVAAPLLRLCPAGSVHVNWRGAYFAFAAQAPEQVFVDVVNNSPPEIAEAATLAGPVCSVLGWAEDLRQGEDFLGKASDEELLRILKVHASPSEVDIRRHRYGFVVLARGAS